MPAQLKHAWFDLIVAVGAVIAYLVLLMLFGPTRAFAALAVMSLSALGPLFYRRPKPGAVIADERDGLIHLRAMSIAWAALWLFLVAFCMLTWQFSGDTIPAERFPQMLAIAWVVVQVSRSLAVVVQYRP